MTLSRTLIGIAIVGSLALPLASAARPPAGSSAKKLYHWVGADGRDHYSDDLPPEALNQAREELSKTGMTISTVGRAQTDEEKAAAKAKAEADAAAAAIAEKVAQSDQVLLSSYPTEADLKRAYDDRIAQQAETLKTIRIELQSQQQSLGSLLVSASNQELSNKPVSADLGKKILKEHSQVLDDQKAQVQQIAQEQKLHEESATEITRYRSLRAAAEARHADGATPAADTSPPKG